MRSLTFAWPLIGTLVVASVAPAQAQLPNPSQTFIGSQVNGVYHVAYSPDGKWLATCGKNGTVVLWDADGKEKLTLKVAEGEVFNAVFTPDSKRLVTAADDNKIHLWDIANGKEIWVGMEHSKSVYVVAISPDGRRIASGGGDHQVIIWDTISGKMIYNLAGHTDRVLGLVFTPDSRRLISSCGTQEGGGDAGGQVKVWDASTGKELFELHDAGSGVITLALSPDGRRLAGACLDKSVRVWEMASGKTCLTLAGHTRPVYGVAFSPDGKRLASCDCDWNGTKGDVKLWDVAAGREMGTLDRSNRWWQPKASSPVWSVAFSPDGNRLAAAAGRFREDGFGAVCVWDLPTTLKPDGAAATGTRTPQELEALWADLADVNAERAYRSVWALRACAQQSVPFLRAHARTPPIADHVARLPKLIEDLDSEDFNTRQRAQVELEKLGSLARPALQQAMETGSVEVRLRASVLLERKCGPPFLTSEELRTLRTIEVLETVVQPEVRATLEKLAAGPAGSFVAADAAMALTRLRRSSEQGVRAP